MQTQAQLQQCDRDVQTAQAEQQSVDKAHQQVQRQLKQAEQQLQAALQDGADAPKGVDESRHQVKALEKRCARLEGRLAVELDRTQQV